jgi:hypothetical protein
MAADFTKFFIVNDDGYPSLSYYPDVDDSDNGDHVMFAEAGTSLAELVRKAEAYAEEHPVDE